MDRGINVATGEKATGRPILNLLLTKKNPLCVHSPTHRILTHGYLPQWLVTKMSDLFPNSLKYGNRFKVRGERRGPYHPRIPTRVDRGIL